MCLLVYALRESPNLYGGFFYEPDAKSTRPFPN